MYAREQEFDFERLYGALGEEGKGRKALGIAEGLEDAGRGGRRWGGIKGLLGCGLLWRSDVRKRRMESEVDRAVGSNGLYLSGKFFELRGSNFDGVIM
jgi:hypothetical protein